MPGSRIGLIAGFATLAVSALVLVPQPARAGGPCRPEREYRFYSGQGLARQHVPMICPPERSDRYEIEPRFGESYRATVQVPPAQAAPEVVSRLSDVAPFIGRCWQAEGFTDDRRRHSATVRLAFRADGSVIGAPRIVFGTPGVKDSSQEAFVSAIINAIARCTPLPLGGGFERAIAGRPYLIRFVAGNPKETKT